MSVRMALAKLAAAAAGGAMLGGGAVHVSEAPSKGEIHHVKPVKVSRAKPAKRVIARRAAPREVHRARRIVTTTTTKSCAPAQQMAMVPVPYMPPMPPQPMGGSMGGGVPVVIGVLPSSMS